MKMEIFVNAAAVTKNICEHMFASMTMLCLYMIFFWTGREWFNSL